MKHNKHRNELFAIEQGVPYETHMKETKIQVWEALQTLSPKPSLTFASLILKQLRFIAWKIWFFQGIVLTAMCLLFFCMYTSDFSRWSGSVLPKFLCCCSGIIIVITIPIMKRASHYQMLELEQSTRFSVGGSLLAQLLFVGIGDLGMLSVLGLLSHHYGMTGSVIFTAVTLPFLTAAVTCVMLWTRTSPPVFERSAILFCTLSVLFICFIMDQCKDLLFRNSLMYQIVYALICLGVLYHQCRHMCLHGEAERML